MEFDFNGATFWITPAYSNDIVRFYLHIISGFKTSGYEDKNKTTKFSCYLWFPTSDYTLPKDIYDPQWIEIKFWDQGEKKYNKIEEQVITELNKFLTPADLFAFAMGKRKENLNALLDDYRKKVENVLNYIEEVEKYL